MRIVVNQAAKIGTRLGDVIFGTVVQRPKNAHEGCYYLVASMMDGTGARALINLRSGSLLKMPQDEYVTPVDAYLTVGAADDRVSARDAIRYQALRWAGEGTFESERQLDMLADRLIAERAALNC